VTWLGRRDEIISRACDVVRPPSTLELLDMLRDLKLKLEETLVENPGWLPKKRPRFTK